MTDKRYYWIKLKTDFFNSEQIDFLMAQENGCEYVVLYQMLCLQTANNNGYLSASIGEMLIPYDIKKIARDTKYFDVDTVTIALELYKRLGLIYEENNDMLGLSGIYRIAGFDDMVGSEVSSAKRVREHRERKNAEKQKALHGNTDVTQEKEIDIYNNNISEPPSENQYAENPCIENPYMDGTGSLPTNDPYAAMTDAETGEVFRLWLSCAVKSLTPWEVGEINSLLAEYGKDKVYTAIGKAAEQGKVNVGYIKGILRNKDDNINGAKNGGKSSEKSKYDVLMK